MYYVAQLKDEPAYKLCLLVLIITYTKISISFLKSVFSEIQSQDMYSSNFPQKSKNKTGLWLTDLSGLTIRGLLFWRETTLKTRVLTGISEKNWL